MSEMIERIANELMKYDAECSDPKIKDYYAKARIVMNAMREPTDDMIASCFKYGDSYTYWYKTMIDAALKD